MINQLNLYENIYFHDSYMFILIDPINLCFIHNSKDM